MCNIDAGVFDIGLVQIGWDSEGFYDREIGVDRRRKLYSEVDLHAQGFAGRLVGEGLLTADKARS